MSVLVLVAFIYMQDFLQGDMMKKKKTLIINFNCAQSLISVKQPLLCVTTFTRVR